MYQVETFCGTDLREVDEKTNRWFSDRQEIKLISLSDQPHPVYSRGDGWMLRTVVYEVLEPKKIRLVE